MCNRFNSYKDNQVLFYGDILGFSSCMQEIEEKNNKKSDNGCDNVLDELYKTEIVDAKIKRIELGVNFIWLSDSFAFASDKSRWDAFKRLLLDFISTLWATDFIFNGAITFGNLHNDKNIMGYRFVEAVRLQEGCHTPEIIISGNAYSNLQFDEKEIYINDDSKFCFDYVYCLLINRLNAWDNRNCLRLSCFFRLAQLCERGLNNSNEMIRNKYAKMVELVVNAFNKVDSNDEDVLAQKKTFTQLYKSVKE